MLLGKNLGEEVTPAVIKGIKELLHQQHPLKIELQKSESDAINGRQSIEARDFRKSQLKKKKRSNRD
jgi:hypothetical protein